ncbi:MAG: heavy metal sensor histidine kinase [Pseudomonadota bacterium]|nr:heavy metal sensor histidine kinase [Pseudomonadota bacterium]
MSGFNRGSLTLRLTLSFSALTTIVLVGIGIVLYRSLDTHFLYEDAMELRGKSELVQHLVARLRSAGAVESLSERLDDALIGHDTLFVEVRRGSGAVVFFTQEAPFSFDALQKNETHAQQIAGMSMWSDTIGEHLYRITRFVLPPESSSAGELYVTLAMNVDRHREFLSRVGGTILLSVIGAAVAAGLLGWLAVRVGLAPVHALAALTSRISAKELDARVQLEHLPPELIPLGQSFNAMLARLEDSFRRLSDFSSDLAHELRTPVGALMTQSQVALSRSRSIENYREVLYSAMEEYERLARMITDMLFLAKADNGLLIPTREPIDLCAEIAALFEFYDALAETGMVRLDVSGAGTVSGDRIMIRRALSNLLSNAIRHTASGGAVSVSIEAQDKDTVISISNPGSPIPAEHLPRLFDRFYRVDAARERATDGAGLGLAITKSILLAHGGDISVTSDSASTRFALTFPH